VKRNTRRTSPGGRQLPSGSAYLVCSETGDWVGDVLDAGAGDSWWRRGPDVIGRYHIELIDSGCSAGHRHAAPSAHRVSVKMAEARRKRASIRLEVSPKR
jgi:hypothetical protein